jgi:hypothetical protein
MPKSQTKKRPEYFDGNHSAMPHAVMDSKAFVGATDMARSLLFPLIRQHNGLNNGHLHLAPKWLKKQGYTSSSVYKSKDELIERGLIIQTKWGGLGTGANLFALTWLPISNFAGLDIGSSGYQRGAWARCELPPTPRRPKPKNKNQDDHYDDRNSPATAIVTGESLPTSATVTKTPQMNKNLTTATVNNVVNTNTLYKTPRRTVGVKGRSGIKREPYVY